ncbi:hypothetical protein EZ456_24870 [Pedobacter psychrodurus]|uniref:Uncharacterized protein n=1 Tax=Pedobacter psychrodurus TaxID=2530456 RepID=A0A4R0PBX0_9SPHI|nr:hypothetical protein [Pedobacter psychrodurus]TCD13948.1 hypothetical protein EZ456_24870 [Pedobacter psychrodurus]
MNDIEDAISHVNSKLSREELIEHFNYKLRFAEIEVESFRKILAYLNEKPTSSINLKWREEVRHCLNKRKSILSSNEISECVCIRHNVEPDRNIKLKIATTLSKMFDEGEIGRSGNNRDYKYGLKELFTDK